MSGVSVDDSSFPDTLIAVSHTAQTSTHQVVIETAYYPLRPHQQSHSGVLYKPLQQCYGHFQVPSLDHVNAASGGLTPP